MTVDDGFYAMQRFQKPAEHPLPFHAGQPSEPAADCHLSPDGRADISDANHLTEPIDRDVEPSAMTEDRAFQSKE